MNDLDQQRLLVVYLRDLNEVDRVTAQRHRPDSMNHYTALESVVRHRFTIANRSGRDAATAYGAGKKSFIRLVYNQTRARCRSAKVSLFSDLKRDEQIALVQHIHNLLSSRPPTITASQSRPEVS